MDLKNFESVSVLPQRAFDYICEQYGWDDENLPPDHAFISIIGTRDCLKYLNEEDTVHWFKKNHETVLNLEFDDIDEDLVYEGYNIKAMTDEQAQELFDFIEKNKGKRFLIHCRAGFSRSAAVGKFIKEFYGDIYDDITCDWNGANRCVLRKLKRCLYKKNNFLT